MPAPAAPAPAVAVLHAPKGLEPSLFRLTVRSVVHDPGHGGTDPGASGAGGVREKDVTLDVAPRVKALIEEGHLAVSMTRDGDTTLGGRVPGNASGGLSCFGEAIPAQAIAQVCELVWQLRGQATGRQVEAAKVGITANQGLFGHGSSVIVSK